MGAAAGSNMPAHGVWGKYSLRLGMAERAASQERRRVGRIQPSLHRSWMMIIHRMFLERQR